MVGCDVQLVLLGSERSRMLVLGLVLCHTLLTCCVQGSSGCETLSSKYQQCGTDPAGVRDLDCFAKTYARNIKCVWKPGKHTSHKTYTLVIRQQPEYCEGYYNITGVSKTNIAMYKDKNMTVEVFETDGSTKCTRAVFQASAQSLVRCGPPRDVSFWRRAGQLDVHLSWPQEDVKIIDDYSVKYKTLSSQSWNGSVLCHRGKRCAVEDLDSSLVYNVQIQCVINKNCLQCPWSETYTVPSELTTQPDLDLVQDSAMAQEQGRRQLFLTWTFPAKEPFDGYSVSIMKASGEAPRQRIDTTEPEVRLVLSHSAYHVSISAFNNVSRSPAVNRTLPQRRGLSGTRDARLNVTVHSNKSFTVHWNDNLIKTCVCYCVEWSKKGQEARYKSFFENENNYRNISISPEHLEPFERYSITLHTRPNKDTCNLKRVNDSERTYGSTQFYLTQGTPVRAPANISSYNVTANSAVLEWTSILEEDARGFLLGYTVHYTEYSHNGTEMNVTVDPEVNHYKLDELKSGTAYTVQVSGVTQAGGGVRSASYLFKTNHQGHFDSRLRSIITVFAVILTLLLVGPTIIKRTKVVVWPSIPNPGNSNAMKAIEGTSELEILESINTLKVEEWDTDSLQIVEKETVIAAESLPCLHTSEDQGSASDWFQADASAPAGILPDASRGAASGLPLGGVQVSPYTSEYTTMEMFNQMTPRCVQANADVSEAEKSESEDTDLKAVKSGLDYIRQFSSSPTLDREVSTFL